MKLTSISGSKYSIPCLYKMLQCRQNLVHHIRSISKMDCLVSGFLEPEKGLRVLRMLFSLYLSLSRSGGRVTAPIVSRKLIMRRGSVESM